MKTTSVRVASEAKLTAGCLLQPVARTSSRPRHLTAASSRGEIVELPPVIYTAAELAQSKAPVRPQQSLMQKSVTASPTPASPPPPQPSPQSSVAPEPRNGVSFGDVMSFGGAAPELTNSRLAMLGFVAATGAEISSGESILRQILDEPSLVNLTIVAVIIASLAPALQGRQAEAYGPFTPQAEILNGRAAMIGFAALLATELATGTSALDVISNGMPVV